MKQKGFSPILIIIFIAIIAVGIYLGFKNFTNIGIPSTPATPAIVDVRNCIPNEQNISLSENFLIGKTYANLATSGYWAILNSNGTTTEHWGASEGSTGTNSGKGTWKFENGNLVLFSSRDNTSSDLSDFRFFGYGKGTFAVQKYDGIIIGPSENSINDFFKSQIYPFESGKMSCQNTKPTTTNWKNYTNTTYGYSFQYPGDLTVGSNAGMEFSPGQITLESQTSRPAFRIQGVNKQNIKSDTPSLGNPTSAEALGETIYNRIVQNTNTYSDTLEKIHQINFANQNAFSFSVSGSGITELYGEELASNSTYTYIILDHEGSFILIVYGNDQVYSQVISTFKFITTSQEDIKSYITNQLGIYCRTKNSCQFEVSVAKDAQDLAQGTWKIVSGQSSEVGGWWATTKGPGGYINTDLNPNLNYKPPMCSTPVNTPAYANEEIYYCLSSNGEVVLRP